VAPGLVPRALAPQGPLDQLDAVAVWQAKIVELTLRTAVPERLASLRHLRGCQSGSKSWPRDLVSRRRWVPSAFIT
jgi:hypothetical protein